MAVAVTWMSDAPLDGIVALTSSSSSSTGIDLALLWATCLRLRRVPPPTYTFFALFAADILVL